MSVVESATSVPELAWLKSSYSSGAGGECVEVARALVAVHVRDSKDRTGSVLTVEPDAWREFVGFAARLDV